MRKIFTPLLVVAALPALAQAQTISGRVLGSDGGALPGATVLEQGTTHGTIIAAVRATDARFTLPMPQREINNNANLTQSSCC